MKNLRFALLGAALAGVLAATASADAPTTVTIKMVAQNDSGETGTATLTQVADGVRVSVKLDGAPKDVPQPTHIHVGNCGHINKAPEYPLASTTNGASLDGERHPTCRSPQGHVRHQRAQERRRPRDVRLVREHRCTVTDFPNFAQRSLKTAYGLKPDAVFFCMFVR
jgi:Cu/Zn superoxide dismutase